MKIHILLTPDPPRLGTTLQAICGAQVPSAQPIRHEDEEFPRQTIIFCRQCQKNLTEAFRHYVTWIISGEESKQMEGEA